MTPQPAASATSCGPADRLVADPDRAALRGRDRDHDDPPAAAEPARVARNASALQSVQWPTSLPATSDIRAILRTHREAFARPRRAYGATPSPTPSCARKTPADGAPSGRHC